MPDLAAAMTWSGDEDDVRARNCLRAPTIASRERDLVKRRRMASTIKGRCAPAPHDPGDNEAGRNRRSTRPASGRWLLDGNGRMLAAVHATGRGWRVIRRCLYRPGSGRPPGRSARPAAHACRRAPREANKHARRLGDAYQDDRGSTGCARMTGTQVTRASDLSADLGDRSTGRAPRIDVAAADVARRREPGERSQPVGGPRRSPVELRTQRHGLGVWSCAQPEVRSASSHPRIKTDRNDNRQGDKDHGSAPKHELSACAESALSGSLVLRFS